MSWVIFILQVIGALPFFTCNSLVKSACLSRWSKMATHLIIVTHGVLECYFFVAVLRENKIIRQWQTHSKTVNVNQSIEFSLCIIVSLSIALICYVRTRDQLNVLKRLMDAGCNLRKVNAISAEQKCKYNVLLEISLAIACVAYAFLCAWLANDWHLQNFLLYCIYWIQMTFSNANLSFVGSVCFTVFSRLRYLNNELERAIRGSDANILDIVLLLSLYGELCETIRSLNSCYGLIVLIGIAFNCYTIAKESFFLFVISRRGYKSEEFLGCFLWISLYSLYLISICIRCGRLKIEVSSYYLCFLLICKFISIALQTSLVL